MTDIDWVQINDDVAPKWKEIFHKSKKEMDVEGNCPVCGEETLHRWFMKGRPINQIIQGNKFVAQGGLWEWCSSCGSFEHYSALVPDWWKCDLEVDMKELRFTPDAIEEARLKQISSEN